MRPDKLSPSAINTWFTCPFQYYCRYISRRNGIKTPDTTSFGLAIHDIIDHYYNILPKQMIESDIPIIVEKAYTELANWSTQSRKTDTRKTQQSLIDFERQRFRKGISPPSIREKMLEAKISDTLPSIYGKPDAYFADESLIVDWKTGRHDELSDSLKLQGAIYKLLLESNGHKVKKVMMYFLVSGKRVPIPNVNREWIISRMEEIIYGIDKNKYPKRRSALCRKWCEYRLDCDLDGMCPLMIL